MLIDHIKINAQYKEIRKCPSSLNSPLPIICRVTSTQGKGEEPDLCSPGLLGMLFLWPQACKCTQSVILQTSRKWVLFKTGKAHDCYHGKTNRVHNITQHATGNIVNKQLKGKSINQRLNVCTESIQTLFRAETKIKSEKYSQKEKYVQLQLQLAVPGDVSED